MRPEKLADREYYDVVITSVRRSGDYYEIGTDVGCLGVEADKFPIKPKKGMKVRYYGKGFGYIVRGMDIQGKEVYYRTVEEDDIKSQQELDEMKRKADERKQAAAYAGRIVIDEVRDREICQSWMTEAHDVRIDTWQQFARRLLDDYYHDYGSICHAMGATILAAGYAFDQEAGITGFQSGAVLWDFVREWMHKKDTPLRFLDYSDMLYPQYSGKFHSIDAGTFEWLQNAAREKLANANSEFLHPETKRHWELIVAGVVPFGYYIEPRSLQRKLEREDEK